MPVRFVVEQLFHLRQRGVILVVGRMLAGTITGRTTLQDERTGSMVKVLGVELIPAPVKNPEQLTLILDPPATAMLRAGTVLVSAVPTCTLVGRNVHLTLFADLGG